MCPWCDPSARLAHSVQHTAWRRRRWARLPGQEQHMGLRYSSVVNAPVAEVFAGHERKGALPRLLPPWQPLKVLQEAPSLVDGQAVLQLPGRVRWVAQHSDDDPPWRFVDELVSLPLHWRHPHT